MTDLLQAGRETFLIVTTALRHVSSIVLCAGLLTLVSQVSPREANVRVTFKCTEDMACWDCETMGNLLCGIPET